MTFLVYWDRLCKHLREIPWEGISEPGASVATELYERIQVGNYVYIPHCKYQVIILIYLHGFQLLVLL